MNTKTMILIGVGSVVAIGAVVGGIVLFSKSRKSGKHEAKPEAEATVAAEPVGAEA